MKSFCLKDKRGLSLVEIVIVSAIVLLLSVVLISSNLAYFRTAQTSLASIKAAYLAEEGIEVVNHLKNINWANLGSIGTNYYLTRTGSVWSTTTTPTLIDNLYERKFYTEEVFRDANKDIVATGGTTDPDSRKLTVEISWRQSTGTTTKTLSSYVMKHDEE